ncbi:hypothetical protein [Planctomicrobium piriforme]|uniref:Uncharacterized protein n=1 Tax=Planctomicrobium piriforme TaxID=1576369 RepID=A0A1I3LVF3_9PLAN|nr:hypothetical protein [Planctomicrobium piriforme]SFI88436.1 hypothetical protein SAMN05421753_11370 [Planctomicrobium piriforme]
MPINIPRGKTDEVIDQIIDALQKYAEQHPQAKIDLYRQNPVSVRVRIVDPEFSGQRKPERNHKVWTYLDQLPEEVQSDISTLLLLTPDEKSKSFANFEFDDPVPSQL